MHAQRAFLATALVLAGAAVLPGAAAAAVSAKVDFQPAGAPTAAGYAADTGAAYSAARGSGWVRQDSLTAAAHVGLDVSARTRTRMAVADRRLDTLVLVQDPAGPAAAWELAVPSGDYTVTVAAGDPSYTDSKHRVRVEGTVAIAGFTPSGSTRSATATVTVRVTDGRLTIDASGGTNTKLQYVDVAEVVPPPPAVPADAPPLVDFQPGGSVAASGYAGDTGLPFAAARGYGWVRQDSLAAAAHVGLDVSDRTRDRNAVADQRQDTLVSMQGPPGYAAPVAAAWEAVVPLGDYRVTVSAGDASYFDSAHRLNVEGVPALSGFTPSAAERFRVATVSVRVTDGRLTIDAAGGMNTKLDYVDIAPVVVVVPPPPVPEPTATITVPEPTVTVPDATATVTVPDPVVTTTVPEPTTTAPEPTTTATVLEATTTVPEPTQTVPEPTTTVTVPEPTVTVPQPPPVPTVPDTPPLRVNLQPAGTPVPTGYVADTGAPYTAPRGSGWVREDSLAAATHVGLDVAARTRDRNAVADQRQDTFVSMQSAPGYAASVPAAWEAALPNGDYAVTVGVGDASYVDSVHRVNVEGVPAIAGFTPTTADRFRVASVTVRVSDGRLTIDAKGGVNTKLDHVDVDPRPAGTVPLGSWPASWTAAAPAPEARFEAAGASFGGKLYAFGGFRDEHWRVHRTYARYDPATNTWTTFGTLPAGMAESHQAVASDADHLYFAGGLGGDYQSTEPPQRIDDQLWRYDPRADTWLLLGHLPAGRAAGGMALIGRTLHYFAGVQRDQFTDMPEHYTYDLDTRTWGRAAAVPDPKDHFSTVVLGGKVYLVGGEYGHHERHAQQTSVHRYDPVTDTWRRMADIPLAKSHIESGTFVHNGRIIMAGGQYDTFMPTAQVASYDPIADVWTTLTPALPAARQGAIVQPVGDKVVVTMGGLRTDQPQAATWVGSL